MISPKSLRQNETHTQWTQWMNKAQRKVAVSKPTPEIVKLRARYFLLGSLCSENVVIAKLISLSGNRLGIAAMRTFRYRPSLHPVRPVSGKNIPRGHNFRRPQLLSVLLKFPAWNLKLKIVQQILRFFSLDRFRKLTLMTCKFQASSRRWAGPEVIWGSNLRPVSKLLNRRIRKSENWTF